MIGTFLYERLTTFPSLPPLIGDRVYPLLLPQESSTPAVVYFIQDQRLIDSKVCFPLFFRSSVLINCWVDANMGQDAYSKLTDVEREVIKALHGYTGTSSDGIKIHGSVFNMSNDARDDTFLSFMKTIQFLIDYEIP